MRRNKLLAVAVAIALALAAALPVALASSLLSTSGDDSAVSASEAAAAIKRKIASEKAASKQEKASSSDKSTSKNSTKVSLSLSISKPGGLEVSGGAYRVDPSKVKTITLSWSCKGDCDEYEVSVSGGVYSATTKKKSAKVSVSDLAPGKYTATVKAIRDGKAVAKAKLVFRVLATEAEETTAEEAPAEEGVPTGETPTGEDMPTEETPGEVFQKRSMNVTDESRGGVGDKYDFAGVEGEVVATEEAVGNQEGKVLGQAFFRHADVVGVTAHHIIETGHILNRDHGIRSVKRHQNALHTGIEVCVGVVRGSLRVCAWINGNQGAAAFLPIYSKLSPAVIMLHVRVLQQQVADGGPKRHIMVHHLEANQAIHRLPELSIISGQAVEDFVGYEPAAEMDEVFQVVGVEFRICLKCAGQILGFIGTEVNLVLLRIAAHVPLIPHVGFDKDYFSGHRQAEAQLGRAAFNEVHDLADGFLFLFGKLPYLLCGNGLEFFQRLAGRLQLPINIVLRQSLEIGGVNQFQLLSFFLRGKAILQGGWLTAGACGQARHQHYAA